MGLHQGHPTLHIPLTAWSHLLRADQPLPLGRWVHLAGTFDGQTLRIYIETTPPISTATWTKYGCTIAP